MFTSKNHSTKKREIIRDYNNTSEFYDKRYKKIQLDKYNLVLDNFDYDSELTLDAGCGTGLLFDTLHLEKGCKYVALDISIKMLNQFRLKHQNNNGSLILGDIENLPFRSNIFDLVISITSLQNLPDLYVGILELLKVSKLGAKLILSILKKDKRLEDIIINLKPRFKKFKILNEASIEDLVIKGFI